MKRRFFYRTKALKFLCVLLCALLLLSPPRTRAESGEGPEHSIPETVQDGEGIENETEAPEPEEQDGSGEPAPPEEEIPDEGEPAPPEEEIPNEGEPAPPEEETPDEGEPAPPDETGPEGEVPPEPENPESGETPLPTEPESEGEAPAEPEEEEKEEEEFFFEPDASAAQTFAAGERVVYDFDGLRDALVNNNGVTTVYFGADIVMEAPGIRVHESKTHVIIDGYNPLDPGQTKPHSLTDHATGTFAYTIHIDTGGVKSLLVRDLNLTGRNFYGSFSVLEAEATKDLVITYQRVTYSGPQIGHHRRGTLRFIDCDISIRKGDGGSANQEFAEAKHLRFEGKNSIETVSDLYSTFWLPLGGTFTVADDSSLSVRANNLSTFGLFYADTYPIAISVGQRSSLDIEINGRFAPELQAPLTGLTVDEGGSFRLRTTAAAGTDVLVMDGPLTVREQGSFVVQGYGGSGYPLLTQKSGDIHVGRDAIFQLVAERTYQSLLELHGGELFCGDPAGVLLYNPGDRLIRSAGSDGTVVIESEQLNYWTVAGPGGFDDRPKYRWKKADGSNLRVTGSISRSGGGFTSLDTNYAEGDEPGTAITAATLDMTTARVLAFGRLELEVNALDEKSTFLSGMTAAGAQVRAGYTETGGNAAVTPEAPADESGLYLIPLEFPLTAGLQFDVASNFRYLTAYASVIVESLGRIEFVVPDELRFYTAKLQPKTQTVRRLAADWSILVSDTREEGGDWSVYVKQLTPLTPLNPNAQPLPHALVFVDASGMATPLDQTDPLLLYRHTFGQRGELTSIQWERDRGILVQVEPGHAVAGAYTARLQWIMTNAP